MRDLRTSRLYLRQWRAEDAALLLPILESSVDHLRWIPAHVAAPAPLAELAERLSAFGADFQASRSWRFGVFSPDEAEVFGEVSLFPRSAQGRVHLSAADRLEIGYWLREDVTGRGYATEAASALLSLGSTLPGMRQIEIRCDARNEASAAVPRRLGFRLLTAPAKSEDPSATDMVWVYDLGQPHN